CKSEKVNCFPPATDAEKGKLHHLNGTKYRRGSFQNLPSTGIPVCIPYVCPDDDTMSNYTPHAILHEGASLKDFAKTDSNQKEYTYYPVLPVHLPISAHNVIALNLLIDTSSPISFINPKTFDAIEKARSNVPD